MLASSNPLFRVIEEQDKILSRIKELVRAELGMQAVAGWIVTHAHDVTVTLHS
jgi:hypothetical protein